MLNMAIFGSDYDKTIPVCHVSGNLGTSIPSEPEKPVTKLSIATPKPASDNSLNIEMI